MKKTHKIDLTINGWTTRFASFYVNEKYSDENEVRLYKNLLFDNTYQSILDENNLSYIEFDLNNSLLKLEEIIYESNEEIFNE